MTTTLSVRIDGDTKNQLEALAKRARRSKSFLAAEAIAAYRDDLHELTAQSIRDNVRCPWNHELTRSGHPTGTPEIRQLRQAIDRGE